MDDNKNALSAAIPKLLRPLVRLLIKNGVPFKAFAEMTKRVYVEVAGEDFILTGRKPSVSRVAVLTGLSRKEVTRVRDASPDEGALSVEKYNRAARVISGWVRDQRFHDESGRPRVLPVESGDKSFAGLVKHYSGDMPTRAVLDELLRVGAVDRTGDGEIRLLARAYIPAAGDAEKIEILGVDVADLIGTIDHNLDKDNGKREPRYQRKVSYDNLPEEALPVIRELASRRGQELLELLDQHLSQHDRDVTPEADGTGRARAGVGIYYFEEKAGEK